MKTWVLLTMLAVLALPSTALARGRGTYRSSYRSSSYRSSSGTHVVHSYVKKDGTYVREHRAKNPRRSY